MLWTAIVIYGTGKHSSILCFATSHIVFTSPWDVNESGLCGNRRRALERFEDDHPDVKVVALLPGDHEEFLCCYGHNGDRTNW